MLLLLLAMVCCGAVNVQEWTKLSRQMFADNADSAMQLAFTAVSTCR
jgi:hypothetical protein